MIKFILYGFLSVFCLTACSKKSDEITDNEWVAISIKLENGTFLTPVADYLLTFDNGSKFKLQLDKNSCMGRMTFGENRVSVDDGISCTEACCDSEFAEILVESLQDVDTWRIIETNRLLFTNKSGLEVLFEKK